jgi:hypothetical protein
MPDYASQNISSSFWLKTISLPYPFTHQTAHQSAEVLCNGTRGEMEEGASVDELIKMMIATAHARQGRLG